MVLEEDRVSAAEVDLDYRYHSSIELAGTGSPVELGQVAHSGRLAPTRVADRVTDVERRSAPVAGASRRRALGMAPAALDALVHIGHRGVTPGFPERPERYHNNARSSPLIGPAVPTVAVSGVVVVRQFSAGRISVTGLSVARFPGATIGTTGGVQRATAFMRARSPPRPPP